jgi:hypothetical protein
LTPSPILKVLSSLSKNKVQFLMMGGQACILYGAAEFSRDLDIAIHLGEDNLERLATALEELDAEPIYFPTLSRASLEAGHACHFRCGHPEARAMRLDVMARQRGVDDWGDLWVRRTELDVEGVGIIPLMGLPDLVQAKKTQSDKDWPMIRRLVEADVQAHALEPDGDRVRFWLRECRTPELLVELAQSHEKPAREQAASRAAVRIALEGDADRVLDALRAEEDRERQLDRAYWKPLREELERMRRARR